MNSESSCDLVSAILELKNKPCKDSKDILWEELNKSHFFIATEGNNEQQLHILNTSNGNGEIFLPLFTSIELLEDYVKKSTSHIRLFCRDAWALAIDSKEYSGVVINPSNNALPLNLAQVKYLASITNKHI